MAKGKTALGFLYSHSSLEVKYIYGQIIQLSNGSCFVDNQEEGDVTSDGTV